MRRFQALLIAAGLAIAPSSAFAGPSQDSRSPHTTVEKFAWSTSKGRLGVLVIGLTPELRQHFGAAPERGVLVARVEPGTPAAQAGLAVGDVIVEVRGQAITGATDVLAALADQGKGQTIAVRVIRDGHPVALQATLADDPAPRMFDGKSPDSWFRELMKSFDHQPGWFFDPPWNQPKVDRDNSKTTLRS